MSDTAKELTTQFRKDVYDELLASLLRREASRYSLEHIAENVTHEIMKHAGQITRRIEQLERGIERANTDAHMDGDYDWFLASEVNKDGVVGRLWPSLMQLIEELGSKGD